MWSRKVSERLSECHQYSGIFGGEWSVASLCVYKNFLSVFMFFAFVYVRLRSVDVSIFSAVGKFWVVAWISGNVKNFWNFVVKNFFWENFVHGHRSREKKLGRVLKVFHHIHHNFLDETKKMSGIFTLMRYQFWWICNSFFVAFIQKVNIEFTTVMLCFFKFLNENRSWSWK